MVAHCWLQTSEGADIKYWYRYCNHSSFVTPTSSTNTMNSIIKKTKTGSTKTTETTQSRQICKIRLKRTRQKPDIDTICSWQMLFPSSRLWNIN